MGFRVLLEGAQASVEGLDDTSGRGVILHTNFTLADGEERYSQDGLKLIRSLLGYCLQRGRLTELPTATKALVLSRSLKNLVARKELFTGDQQILSLRLALDAAAAVEAPHLVSALLNRAVTVLITLDDQDPALFYNVAFRSGQMEVTSASLTALRVYMKGGQSSLLLPDNHRAYMRRIFDESNEMDDEEMALYTLTEAFANLIAASGA
jgi:hypothetical protein